MIRIERTDASNEDFRTLVALLDAELREWDGDDHPFFAQFNKLDMIKHVVMAYEEDRPAGCGAFKYYSDDTAEIKRMYVPAAMRGRGIAVIILGELETWASEEGYRHTILETGYKQAEAVRLYEKCGYDRIPNYGQYIDSESSRCYTKSLS